MSAGASSERQLEEIGNRVRRLRVQKGLSQDRLALEAHVDQSGLSKVERGNKGLGEGFTSYADSQRQSPFRIALSIEKDPFAHATLELRAFFRQFRNRRVPSSYYRFLRGELSRDGLFSAHRREARVASSEAWQA